MCVAPCMCICFCRGSSLSAATCMRVYSGASYVSLCLYFIASHISHSVDSRWFLFAVSFQRVDRNTTRARVHVKHSRRHRFHIYLHSAHGIKSHQFYSICSTASINALFTHIWRVDGLTRKIGAATQNERHKPIASNEECSRIKIFAIQDISGAAPQCDSDKMPTSELIFSIFRSQIRIIDVNSSRIEEKKKRKCNFGYSTWMLEFLFVIYLFYHKNRRELMLNECVCNIFSIAMNKIRESIQF